MNKLIEYISWVPFEFAKKSKSKSKNFIRLNLKNVGINKTFNFNISKEDEGLSSQLRTFGFREPVNLEHHYKFVKSSDKVLDIGSNIGLFTILSENANKIICVEPLKQAIPILEKNILDNDLARKTKVINAAVGRKGKLIIEVDKKLNLSKIVDKKGKNTYNVSSFELEDLTKKYKINFLRMDVEGYEYEILYGKIPKEIKKISIEFHTGLLGEIKVKELLSYLEQEGFKAKYFIEDLPIRLYPFYSILRKTGLIRIFTYIKRDLTLDKCSKYINKGRKVKYLFLER